MRTLMTLVEHRRQLMNDRVRITNRLRNALKQYYPQPLEWFDHIDTILFCDFIRRWPSLTQARRARRATLEKFFREHNMNRKPLLERRIKAIKSAMPLTTDDAVIVPHRLRALTLVAQLEVTLECIKQYDAEIASLAPQHPDYALFESVTGCRAGVYSAPDGRLRRATRALQQRRRGAKVRRHCAGHASAVASRPGSTGAGNARRSCDRPSLNGPPRPSTNPTGQASTISSSEQRMLAPGRCQSTRVQVDTHPLSMLENSNTVRRNPVS